MSLFRRTAAKRIHNPGMSPLVFANPADSRYRFDLAVRLSYDEGKTWPVAKLLRKGPAAYSSKAVFPDGTIGILYEPGNVYGEIVEYYAMLAFARFNLAWLTDGQDKVRMAKAPQPNLEGPVIGGGSELPAVNGEPGS
jgi:hypothetical protein